MTVSALGRVTFRSIKGARFETGPVYCAADFRTATMQRVVWYLRIWRPVIALFICDEVVEGHGASRNSRLGEAAHEKRTKTPTTFFVTVACWNHAKQPD
jgi:hypothetical protein